MIKFTDRGIYCPQADVYLDPWKPVARALITHGHADHARWGSKHYLCTREAKPVIEYRLNTESPIEAVEYGETVTINGVHFSFHPAGHIIGSAQIRAEYKGEVWVFTGDYKLEDDGLSAPFEAVKCDTFITESTFGLPVYQWKKQAEIFDDINTWWRNNREEGKVSVISGYSLGKAQRILSNIDPGIGKIFVHGAIDNTNRVIRDQGIVLPETIRITKETDRKEWEGGLVLCPPSAVGSTWMRKFLPYSLGIASGWMSLRGPRRRRGADRGFALSDHVDWEGLNKAISATGAQRVYVTHGYSDIFSAYLKSTGLEAHAVKTEYEGEVEEEKEELAEMKENDESKEG